MTTQLYFERGDRQYRLVAKSGLGVLIFNRPDFAATAPEHEHPEAQVSILFGGKVPSLVSHSCTGRTMRVRVIDGSFIYMPPGQPHRMNWHDDGSLVNLYMAPEYLRELSAEIGCAAPDNQIANCPDRGVHQIARLLLDEYDINGGLSIATVDHANALIASRIFQVTAHLQQNPSRGFLSLTRIQPAIDFICDAPERDFDLISLARLCHASVFHFARSFSANVGLPPFAFQRAKRLEKAKTLLKHTDLSIGLIAEAVGMQNAAHFTRSFRRDGGYTPREYRHLHGRPSDSTRSTNLNN